MHNSTFGMRFAYCQVRPPCSVCTSIMSILEP